MGGGLEGRRAGGRGDRRRESWARKCVERKRERGVTEIGAPRKEEAV